MKRDYEEMIRDYEGMTEALRRDDWGKTKCYWGITKECLKQYGGMVEG